MKMSNHSIGARMATALGLVLALLLGAALFGIAALYSSLGTYETTVQEAYKVAREILAPLVFLGEVLLDPEHEALGLFAHALERRPRDLG